MGVLSTTLYELFADNLPANAEKTCVVDPARQVTYAELAREIERVAGWLRARGLRPGDRVVVHVRKSIPEVAAMLAVAKLGGVVVNVSHQWTSEQLLYVLHDSGAALLICDTRAARRMSGSDFSGGVLHVGAEQAPDHDCYELLPEASVPGFNPLDSELAALIYTSGSTGMPKGVMLSHRNILAGARSVARYLGLAPDDRLLSVLPYCFDYGLNQLTTMLLLGGTVVHQPVMMAAEILRMARDAHVTGIAAVPPLWNQIVRQLLAEEEPLSGLRRVTNSGGKLSTTTMDAMPRVFPGAKVFLMYGLTESFRSTYLDPSLFETKKGSIGKAVPGAEVYVIRNGEGLATQGQVGELVHRGPFVSMGYWGKPSLTAERIRSCPELTPLLGDEPVVFSGDLVWADEDGDLWFVGRNDAMIKTSGFRVSPEEIEGHIQAAGLVAEVVAFGMDDDDLGQVVHIAVEPLQGFSAEELLRRCRASMPSYMVPRHIHARAGNMPRTASGKLARSVVVQNCKTAPGAEAW